MRERIDLSVTTSPDVISAIDKGVKQTVSQHPAFVFCSVN